MCSDKKCQDTKFMWPGQPAKKKSCYMQSMPRPAKLQPDYNKKNQVKSVCNDKNCQSTQCVNMWTAMKNNDMQSKEPAMQSNFNKKHVPLCNDKNCQSTRCCKKKCLVIPVCGDKNCQSAKPMCYDKKH